jgi:hypothetical protein
MKEDAKTSGRPWLRRKNKLGEGGAVDDEEMLQSVRAADPVGEEDLRDWAGSEAGRQVYARILARRQDDVPVPSRRPRTLRVLMVATGLAAVVAAIVVALVVGLGQSPGPVVESSTTTVTVPGEAADRVEALARVVLVAEAAQGRTDLESYPTPTGHSAAYADMAQSLGILLASERASVITPGSVSRATYALWLWRGLGDRLTQVREVSFADLGTVPEDVRQAVIIVAGAGILDGYTNAQFEPDRALSAAEEQEAVARLEKALNLSTDVIPSR